MQDSNAEQEEENGKLPFPHSSSPNWSLQHTCPAAMSRSYLMHAEHVRVFGGGGGKAVTVAICVHNPKGTWADLM